jgi:hypothetical protein
MRSFSSRADCVVSDEPFYAAYLARNTLDHPGRDEVIASQPTDWRIVATQLSTGPAPLPRPVWYQKHMAHHMRAEMLDRWLDSLDHALLIRHPGRVIASYSKVSAGMSLDETGLPWQVRLLDHLRAVHGTTPPVIDADQLRRAPEPTLRALCAALGLAWAPAMLSWPVGPHPQDGVWAKHWYANTWTSTGFTTDLTPESVPARPDVPFYDEAVALYEQLRAHAVSI